MNDNPFVYQKPDEIQIEHIVVVRDMLRQAYETILKEVPMCAERTLAIRKLEEASMWCNKAIAFRGEPYL